MDAMNLCWKSLQPLVTAPSLRTYALLLASLPFAGRSLSAQEPEAAPQVAAAVALTPKIKIANQPTLPTISISGEVFWSDHFVQNGWRIQKHGQVDLFRILDEKGFRRAWGSFEDCRAELDQVCQTQKWEKPHGTAVITLHGLFRSRACMESLGRSLAQDDSWSWVNVGYASTQGTVEDHARSLSHVLDNLEGYDKLHFVCHSLGNLVVRRYVAEAAAESPRWKVDPRISRMVMLGPPNQGAALAKMLKGNKLATWVGGPVVGELSPDSTLLANGLATPKFEFGILAGDYSKGNPFIKGQDDFVVAVEETKLEGAKDFRVLPLNHSELVRSDNTHKHVVAFLKTGSFTTPDESELSAKATP